VRCLSENRQAAIPIDTNLTVGDFDGALEGDTDGDFEGLFVGTLLGLSEGECVGLVVGCEK